MNMSNLKEMFKARKENEMNFLFNGGFKMVSNKYFTFNRVINDDEIIIVTNNIKYWNNKDQYVLVIDNDKVVYLKSWQVAKVKNYDLGINSYVVKLNRNYFKSYQLGFKFDDMSFEKENSFDDLLKVAKAQNQENIKWALGWL